MLRNREVLSAIGALGLILGLAYKDWHDYQHSTSAARGVSDASFRMDRVLSSLEDAETGQRGFLLIGAQRYLQPYEKARREYPAQMEALTHSLSEVPGTEGRVADLKAAIADKFDELQQTIDLRRQNHMAEAIAIVESDRGKKAMDHIRGIFDSLQAELRAKVDSQRKLLDEQTLRARIISTAASCLLFILVAIASLKFKREKEAAQTANEAKSIFLANMSHELRTPLNAIIGYSEMLLEEAEETNQTALSPDLEKIKMAGKHLLELINAVLDLSKIEAGKMELYLETFSVPKLAEEIVSVIGPAAQKNGNSVSLTIDENVTTMRADQTKVRQTLYNLLSNACKFTSRGSVKLAIRALEGGKIAFAVEDTGVGMSAEQANKLFEPFVQADASTSRKFGGTGLGLVISRRFARMMGGDITLLSAPGKGSTFTLTLPVMASAGSGGAVERAKAGSEPAGAAGTVLIIDDEEIVHELLSRTLAKYGFKIESALNGEEGLRLARKLHPQAITLDVMMPGMDGWTVLSALKSDAELAEIPVVMLTVVDNKNFGYSLGAADYLTKPVDRERLTSVLLRYRGNSAHSALVVEDDPNSREVLKRMLEKEGWVVHEADNGRSALEQMGRVCPSIVLLDLMMPEMDGFDFLDEMHGHKEWKSIPVVVITAKDLTTEDRNRLNGHVNRVLQKSQYRREELMEQVSQAVARRASARNIP